MAEADDDAVEGEALAVRRATRGISAADDAFVCISFISVDVIVLPGPSAQDLSRPAWPQTTCRKERNGLDPAVGGA
jgi:hypothetical protein